MCSKKWESPLIFFSSYLDPVATMIKTAVVGELFMGIVTIRKPFFNLDFIGFIIVSIPEKFENWKEKTAAFLGATVLGLPVQAMAT